jgi:hypothetical protein
MGEPVTFYAVVPAGKRKLAQLLVTVVDGHTVKKEYTGKTYKTSREAWTDMERLNCIEKEKPITDNSQFCGSYPCAGGKNCWMNVHPTRLQCAKCLCSFCTLGKCTGGELIRKERSGKQNPLA